MAYVVAERLGECGFGQFVSEPRRFGGRLRRDVHRLPWEP